MAKLKSNLFFFDIESGGFEASKSQLFSLATARDQERPRLFGVQRQSGSQLSKWSENKIWKPLLSSGVPLRKEEGVLSQFAKQLETAPKGSNIVGWNIGYSAVPQEVGAAGFDVPFLVSRAQKYPGMSERMQSAFRRHSIHDLGGKWAYDIAEGAAGPTGQKLVSEGVMHPDLHAEAVGFMKQAKKAAYETGISNTEDLSEELYRRKIRFSGWKQELVYETLTGRSLANAHEASADVGALQEIFSSGKQVDEDFLRKWSPLALKNKLISRAKYQPMDPAEATPERWKGILSEAEAWNVDDLESSMRQVARESGVPFSSVERGRGVPTIMAKNNRLLERFSSEFMDEGLNFARQHKGKIGIVAGLGLLTIAKPGAWFSGQDDEYNTIEGLFHGGMAEQQRHELSDFGSGWIRTAVSKGMSFEKIATNVTKLGTGKSGLASKEFRAQVLSKLHSNPDDAIKFVRESQGINVQGQRWMYGNKLGEGKFGDVWMGYRAGGQSQAGVIKTLKNVDEEPMTALAAAMRSDPGARPGATIQSPGMGQRAQMHAYRGDKEALQPYVDFAETHMREVAGTMNAKEWSVLQYEAAMQSKAKDATDRFVPEVFASSPTALVSEVAGQPLGDPTKGLGKFLRDVPGRATGAAEGVVHLDPHLGNVMRRGANYTMIDYGYAIQASRKTQASRKQFFTPAYEEFIENVMQQPSQANIGTPILGEGATQTPLLQATGTIDLPDGAMAAIGKKALTDFGSPVNLNRATNRAAEAMSASKKVDKVRSPGILEAKNAAGKRKSRMIQAHQTAMVQRAKYAHRPGKRHITRN